MTGPQPRTTWIRVTKPPATPTPATTTPTDTIGHALAGAFGAFVASVVWAVGVAITAGAAFMLRGHLPDDEDAVLDTARAVRAECEPVILTTSSSPAATTPSIRSAARSATQRTSPAAGPNRWTGRMGGAPVVLVVERVEPDVAAAIEWSYHDQRIADHVTGSWTNGRLDLRGERVQLAGELTARGWAGSATVALEPDPVIATFTLEED